MAPFLASCPYCLCNAAKTIQTVSGYSVCCHHCHAQGPSDERPADAIQRWNDLGNELSNSRANHAERFSSALRKLESELAPH